MTGTGLLSKDSSYVLQLELWFCFLLNWCLRGFQCRIVVAGKLLLEPVGYGINRSSSASEFFDGLVHFCHL